MQSAFQSTRGRFTKKRKTQSLYKSTLKATQRIKKCIKKQRMFNIINRAVLNIF